MNNQPIEKLALDPDGVLDVHSIFLTIQGEGPFAGRRAIFVRLAGCNLICPMCDTDYTSTREKVTPGELVDRLKKIRRPGHLIVITGGEPFRQNLRPAIELMLRVGYDVQIETNGTLYQPLPYDWITIVCSPKTGNIHKHLLPHLSALKYVVAAGKEGDDGLPLEALGNAATPFLARPSADFAGPIYIQPEDSKEPAANSANLTAAINCALDNDYTLGIQLHKHLNME
jgi:7-carboxy-7-deazaguanine synthase